MSIARVSIYKYKNIALMRNLIIKIIPRIYAYFTIIVVLILIVLYEVVDVTKTENWYLTISFYVIGALSAYNLCRSNTLDGISLRVIFWFFNLIFFFFTAYLKYLTNRYEYEVSELSLLKANLMILLYSILFILAYSYSNYKTTKRLMQVPEKSYERFLLRIPSPKLLTAIALSYVIFFYFIVGGKFSWQAIMGAREEFGPIQSIIQFYLRPITFFVFLYSIINVKINKSKSKVCYFFLVLSCIPAIILNFPFSTNRFYVFSIYLGLLLILYPPHKKNRTVYLLVVFIGILGSLVLNNLMRSTTQTTLVYLTGTTFDAYESFVYAINYVNDNGITWGRQLLGGLLFWIPREIWPDKPIGTGSFVISTYYNALFTNVSSPLIEEGYINFSLIGVVGCSLSLGLLFGYCDVKYKMSLLLMKTDHFIKGIHRYIIFYPISVGFSLFALRGDFMSSFAYFLGIFSSFLTVSFLIVRYKKKYIDLKEPASQKISHTNRD